VTWTARRRQNSVPWSSLRRPKGIRRGTPGHGT
jgi:hypothetical protein